MKWYVIVDKQCVNKRVGGSDIIAVVMHDRPKTTGRFPADRDLRGVPLIPAKCRTSAGAHLGTPSDDGVPRVPLKSRYLKYRDFSDVQLFAAISGTIPLAPIICRKFSSAALGLFMYDSNRQLSLPRPLFDSLRKISAVLKKAKAKKLIQFRQNIMQVNKRAGGRDYIV